MPVQQSMMKFALFCFLAVSLCRGVEAIQILRPYPQNLFAISGTEANLTCIFRDTDRPPVRARFMRREPFPGTTWFDINSTERVFQTNSTQGNIVTVTLHFKKIEVQDDAERGRYECVGTSATGAEKPHGFNIKVTPREDLPVPRVVPSQTASYGDNIRLHCNLTHKGNPSTTPITQLTYLKDGRPVKITNDVEDPLIFTDVRAEDGGNYTCRLLVLLYRQMPYNVTGAAAASLRVRVRFAFTKSTVISQVGDTVVLVCSAQGYPMTVEWSKLDGEKESEVTIRPDERFTLKGECDYCRSVLVITNATKEDSGNYSCSATESQGRQVFMVEVKTNSTSAGSRTLAPHQATAIFSVFLWIWWL